MCVCVQVSLSHTSIAFPPCRTGEAVWQTLCLSNYGDTPASFAFTNMQAIKPHFTVKPSTGVVPAKSSVLVSGCVLAVFCALLCVAYACCVRTVKTLPQACW